MQAGTSLSRAEAPTRLWRGKWNGPAFGHFCYTSSWWNCW